MGIGVSRKANSWWKPLEKQNEKLKQAIADLEAQRSILGDGAVDAQLNPIQQKMESPVSTSVRRALIHWIS